jgi:uncharacterized membrane protein YdcZ (DUF606 family)
VSRPWRHSARQVVSMVVLTVAMVDNQVPITTMPAVSQQYHLLLCAQVVACMHCDHAGWHPILCVTGGCEGGWV